MVIDAVYKGVSKPKDGPEKMNFKAGDRYYSFAGYESGHSKGDKAQINTNGYNITSVFWV